MAASVKVLRAEAPQLSIAETYSSLKASGAVNADESTGVTPLAISILPVDSGIIIESHMVQRFVKGEDLAFQYRADPDLLGRSMLQAQPGDPNEWKLNYDAFIVLDGHSGVQANEFVHSEFLPSLHPLMPLALPASFRGNAGTSYAAAVRAAVARTLESINQRFCDALEPAGCTCTVVLITGSMVTVANIGDSDAVLDTFGEWIPMSVPHRVNDNVAERERIEATGSEIAPLSVAMDGPARGGEPGLGPLRIWPGGLCVSRGIGDVDVGECVIARPHVRQVVIPEWGCRLIVCSDGVWDCISTRVVVSTCKGKSCGAAAQAIVNKCVRVKQGALVDDTTCLVIDCRPFNVPTFKGYYPDKSNGSQKAVLTKRSYTVPAMLQETSMDAVADAVPNLLSAPIPRLSTADSLVQYVQLDTTPTTDSSTDTAQASAAAAPARPSAPQSRPAPKKRSKSSGFLCCIGVSGPRDDKRGTDSDSGEASEGASVRDGTNATSECGSDIVQNATGDGSRSQGGIRRTGSIKGGMQNLLRRRRTGSLPSIALYADVDTAYEALPLSTVSESTDSDHPPHTLNGITSASARADAATPPLSAAGAPMFPAAAEGHSTDAAAAENPRAALDMGFEPLADAEKVSDRRKEVLWHTVSHETSDVTTRPHRHLPYGLPPRPPQQRRASNS